jgi:hypothetical protein
MKVIVALQEDVTSTYFVSVKYQGSLLYFSFANLQDDFPIDVTIARLNPSTRAKLTDVKFYSARQAEETLKNLEAGEYSISFLSQDDTKIEFEAGVEEVENLSEQDIAASTAQSGSTTAYISSLKTTLNFLKQNLKEMHSTMKRLKATELSSMSQVEHIRIKIRNFSIFESLLMILLPLGSVWVLSTYFQNRLKKGSI